MRPDSTYSRWMRDNPHGRPMPIHDVLVLPAERRGEVALSRVVDRRDDRAEPGVTARELQRRRDVASARDAAEDPFLAREPPRRRHAFLRRRGHDPGEDRDVEIARHEAVADALDAVMAPGPTREQRALRGLDGVELHPRVPLAQIASDAGQEAARALR